MTVLSASSPGPFVSQLLSEHITSADEERSPIDIATSNQIYGTPSDAVLEMTAAGCRHLR